GCMNMRRIIALILLSLLAAAAVGCTANDRPGADATNAPEVTEQQEALENPFVITDESGAELGRIDNRANITAMDGGIFYSVLTLEEYAFTGTAEYRFFSLKDDSDVLLGKLEDQGYEAAFARTELDGVMYTLAVQGNPAGSAPAPLLLLACDTANGSMKTYTVSEYGFPYAAMAASNGKLIIMNHETSADKAEKIYEFDPGTEEIREILAFDSSVDSLRSVCAAENGFYLLRLKLNVGGENEVFIDRYDEDHGKVSEQSVGGALVGAIAQIPTILSREDALTETSLNVSRFEVIDGRMLVYENYGLSRAAVDLKTGEAIFANDDNYQVSIGSGGPVIYKLGFDAENAEEPEIIAIENGKAVRIEFTPDETHKLIQCVTVSESGTWAVLMTDDYPVMNASGVIRVRPEK
ncbi:MAG: hypothetical protein J6P98_06770, partial [Clostridia bacterium]|nr:hypothetical protein [Clostridia bacterium]